MSISGIANPGPPILKIRRAGKPGHNLSGHMLKPKANSRRVRVTDLGTNAIIGYFDIETDTGRILLPERVCIELLKIASKTKRKIEAVPVHVMLAKCRQKYLEVHDPCVAGNCLVIDVPPNQFTITLDDRCYALGQDDYFYRLIDDEAFRAPILSFKHFWDAETIFASK